MYSLTVLEDGNQGVKEPRFLQSLQGESAPCLPPFLYLAMLRDLWEFLDQQVEPVPPAVAEGWSPNHWSTREISLPPSSVLMLWAILGFPRISDGLLWPGSPSSHSPLMYLVLCVSSSLLMRTHMTLRVHSAPYDHILANYICKESISPYNHIRRFWEGCEFWGEEAGDTLSTQGT